MPTLPFFFGFLIIISLEMFTSCLNRTRHNSSINIMDHVLNPTEQLFMAV